VNGRNVLLVIGTVIALMVGGGAAYAAISGGPVDSSGTIHGCFTTKAVHGSHALAVQDAGTRCPPGTTAVSWKEGGSAGSSGSVGLSGLQGSPCTVGGHSSTLQVSVNPTTGAVTMACPPLSAPSSYTARVTVSGGTMTAIQISDATNGTVTRCKAASSCSLAAAAGDSVDVDLLSGLDADIPGKMFTYTCGNSLPKSADPIGSAQFVGLCVENSVTGDYNVTAGF
jgi:hypothetical protein